MSLIPPSNPTNHSPAAPPAGPIVQMKVRADLTFDRVAYQGVEYWTVKEPLGQKYYQFPPHVYYLLRQLDGTKTIDQLQADYHREYAPKRITRQDLQQLLTRFHKDGLVTSDTGGQGSELLKRGQKNKWMERGQKLANILAIRWRGFDPERILNFLIRFTGWIFSPAMIVVTMIAASVALLSVVVNWAEFQSRLPGFEQFFDLEQWYIFVGVLAFTKIIHEFGHGLSCKRLDGECHEIGFMLLVLTPCLYCNVSDSWRLPNKWHRAAIGAAGMYVEIILATIATFVWWFVQPGLVQEICLKIMMVSSISTVLFNGNPLLRFDGYYILSDLLEIPNLNQKSTKALTTLLGRHWLGLEIPDDQLMPANRPFAFAMFTVAAFCYRWMIMFVILSFLMKMLEPYGLESVGIGIALFSVAGMIGMPGYKLFKYMTVPGRFHQVKKLRFSLVLAVLLIAIGLVLLVPLPHYLRCSIVVMPQKLETVWIRQTGKLESCEVKPGDKVTAGQVLAQLSSLELELQLAESEGKLEEKKIELQSILNSNSKELGSLDRMAEINGEIRNLTRYVDRLKTQYAEMTVTAPLSGTVMETPFAYQSHGPGEVEDVDQSSLLLGHHENVSAQRGQRFCEIANLDKWYAIVILKENQVKFVQLDQPTKLKLDSRPEEVLHSKVETIGETDFSIDRESFDPPAPGQSSGSKVQQTRPPDLLTELVAATLHQDLRYFARVEIPETDIPLKIGLSGQARLYTGKRSLGARALWWLNQNFRF